jgi:putative PIN family toxin of toxin-antitoxin system
VRVVLDTNIIVSGLMSMTSPPAQILNAVRAGQVVAVMSEATFTELEHVLHRPAVQRYFTHTTITPLRFLPIFASKPIWSSPSRVRPPYVMPEIACFLIC